MEDRTTLREITVTPEIRATTEDTEATKVEATPEVMVIMVAMMITVTTAMIGVQAAAIMAVTTAITAAIVSAGLWISRSGERRRND